MFCFLSFFLFYVPCWEQSGLIFLCKKRHCVKSVRIRSFFWPLFSCIWTEYGEIMSISPYLVRMKENTDQNTDTFYAVSLIFVYKVYFKFRYIPNMYIAQSLFASKLTQFGTDYIWETGLLFADLGVPKTNYVWKYLCIIWEKRYPVAICYFFKF